MTLNNAEPSLGATAEYQASALPWLTSSLFTTVPTRYSFAKVSRFLSVRNYGPGELAVGFTQNGVSGSNRMILGQGQLFEAEFRVKEVWLMAIATSTSASVIVGLTSIPARAMPNLTGSAGGWDGVG